MLKRNGKITADIDGTRLVISVKEAKKILGKKSESMTNEEVEALVATLQFMAESFLQNKGS